MGRAFSQFMSLAMVIVGVLFLVYIMKNPNAKNFLTNIINQFKGIGGTTPSPTPTPITPAPAPAPAPAPRSPEGDEPRKDFTGRSTGPGTNSQDPGTAALDRCLGVGVMPPDPQAYNDCVNMAFPKKAKIAIRLGIA